MAPVNAIRKEKEKMSHTVDKKPAASNIYPFIVSRRPILKTGENHSLRGCRDA